MRKKAAYLGIYLAFALIVSYVEVMIPFSVGIPGVKPGLTNIVVLIALYRIGTREALVLSFLRIVLSGFLYGNLSAIIYSLAGGCVSFLVMWLLKRSRRFSVVGVSLAGGVFHNMGQLIMAMAVLENKNLFYYMPVLMISGIGAGMLVGLLGSEIMKRLPKEILK